MLAVIALAGILVWNGLLSEQLSLRRHPIAFSEHVEAAAREFDVPSEIIYAVIKTESNFKPEAVSRVGAKGLMQLMDSTNEWIAGVIGEEVMAERVFEPEINIRRGTWLLAYLYRQLGSWREAIAAYNAGIGRVLSWLEDPACSPDGKTLAEIPIDETRAYVERVTEAISMYRTLYFENQLETK